MNIFKTAVKDSLRPLVNYLYKKINRYNYLGGNFYCPVCNESIKYFQRLPDYYFIQLDENQFVHSSYCFETMNTLMYSCPNCKAKDRDRLSALFFEVKLKENSIFQPKLLDIAPSKSLRKYLLKKSILYRSADMHQLDVDDQVDITNMKIYNDNTFDIFICSHVLEHVEKDDKAISELYRILKPDGWGIVMVPILLTLEEDLEDEQYVSAEDRWKYYGQYDHVRMYSKTGFVKKLVDCGFIVDQFGGEYFGFSKFQMCGIHKRSILYIVRKR